MNAIQRLTATDVVDRQTSAEERAAKKQHWPKGEHISETPRSNRLVSRAYEDMLILEAMPTRYRGLASVFGVMLLPMAFLFVMLLSSSARGLSDAISANQFGLTVVGVVFVVLGTVGILAPIIGAIRIFRIDLLAPKQIPLVFNRKTRKVYRFIQDVPSVEELLDANGRLTLRSLINFIATSFRPWPGMLLIEYDWDCLEAEYFETKRFTGQVIHTDCHLELYVREAPGSDRVIGSFALVPSILTSEASSRNLWEHVRRFMEESGPALSPGDQPAPPPPKGFWQAANAPFNGPGWLVFLAGAIWTADDVFWFVLMLLKRMIPQSLWEQALHHPMPENTFVFVVKGVSVFFCYPMLGWVLFAVVASYLSPAVELPEDVLRDAGPPVDLAELAKAQAPVAE